MLITKRVDVIKSKTIIKNLIDEKKQTYFIIIKPYNDDLSDVYITRKTLINSAVAKNKNNEIAKISKYLKYYEQLNIKDKIKIFEFSDYNFNNHIINFINEIESLYDFIYSLFENELKVFKVYINKHLVNDFIKYLQLSIKALILFVQKKTIFLNFV